MTHKKRKRAHKNHHCKQNRNAKQAKCAGLVNSKDERNKTYGKQQPAKDVKRNYFSLMALLD